MNKLIIYAQNKKQSAALKALFKAFNIPFEVGIIDYDREFAAKIQESRQQVKRGETRVVNIADL
jgi:hypothetical protein